MAHYINPAFCQKSEFLPQTCPSTSKNANNIRIHKKNAFQSTSQNSERNSQKYQENTKLQFNTSGYALVPLEELSSRSKDRYAIIPPTEAFMLRNSSLRLIRSQDNLDLIPSEFAHQEEEDSFTSLPPAFTPQEDSRKLISAFSSDFINKSMILVDQNSMQRYTIVPTDDDEEVVDSNHEIIEMHNGRLHRYAVIPTDEEMETSENIIEPEITSNNLDRNLYIRMSSTNGPTMGQNIQTKIQAFKPTNGPNLSKETFGENNYIQKRMNIPSNVKSHSTINSDKPMNYMPETPTKNPIATQKLHELLSTPLKNRQENVQRQRQRQGSYQTIIQRSPDQFQLHKPYNQSGFTPQKLEYEDKRTLTQNIDHRTTAIISPRLHEQAVYTTLDGIEKPWPHESSQKVESATATIGVISIMLIITGILNSGLCLYMVTDMRRSYYLDLGIISGFAAAALGTMGFRSRQCYWLPNRNYISGYVLVTVFSLLNCCGLLVLLELNPFPGTPFHDLTTGVILALSSLILLIISLGVITSKWCVAPPPDNRVDVYRA